MGFSNPESEYFFFSPASPGGMLFADILI